MNPEAPLKPSEGKGLPRKKKEEPATSTKIIKTLMKERKVRGNYKDYAIIHAGSLMDWEGLYELTRSDTGERAQFEKIHLVHKRELARFMVPEVAHLFWNPGLGIRIPKKTRMGKLPRKEVNRASVPEAPQGLPQPV
jgi:hypothetical protein